MNWTTIHTRRVGLHFIAYRKHPWVVKPFWHELWIIQTRVSDFILIFYPTLQNSSGGSGQDFGVAKFIRDGLPLEKQCLNNWRQL